MWQTVANFALLIGEGLVIGVVALGMIKVRIEWIFAEIKQVRADVKEAKGVARRAHERIDRIADLGRLQ